MIQVSQMIATNGLPKDKQDLLNYPGVGIKIANLYMKVAENVIDGIGVDVHVHRIVNRLGWIRTNSPEQTEEMLQSLFPKSFWKGLN